MKKDVRPQQINQDGPHRLDTLQVLEGVVEEVQQGTDPNATSQRAHDQNRLVPNQLDTFGGLDWVQSQNLVTHPFQDVTGEEVEEEVRPQVPTDDLLRFDDDLLVLLVDVSDVEEERDQDQSYGKHDVHLNEQERGLPDSHRSAEDGVEPSEEKHHLQECVEPTQRVYHEEVLTGGVSLPLLQHGGIVAEQGFALEMVGIQDEEFPYVPAEHLEPGGVGGQSGKARGVLHG